MAEVYAGFLAHADHHIGRLLDYLEADRAAREHDHRRRLRQRRERRGRPERLGQRDEVRERRCRRPRREPGEDRRARQPEDVQPLPERLGDGVQHAVQDVEALRVQRRDERPVHHLVAGGHRRRAARSATSTTTRSTSCRRSSTCSASSPRRRSRATPRRRSTASACASSFDDASVDVGRKTQFYAMLGSRSIWHEGWKAVTTHPTHRRLGPLQRRRVGALPHRRRPLRAAQPRGRAARQAPGARQHLVLGGRRERRLPARRPLAGRDHDDPAPAAHRPARPLRLLPRHAPVPEWQAVNTQEPLVRDRRARRHPGTRRRGRPLRARARASAATRSTSRTTGCTTSTASSAASSRWSSAPRTSRPATNLILSASFEKDGTGADCAHRDAVALPRRQEGRRGADQDPARRVRDRRRGPLRRPRTPASRSPTTIPASRRTRSPAARSTGSRSTSAASRTSTSSARPP